MNSLRLRDGRTLAYEEYGDPRGRPVFYFHGFPGCRLEIGPADGVAKGLRVRFIAFDRPGVAGSDFQKGRTIADWPDDVKEAAEQLGIERFAVLGVSGGGPYAAACGAKLADMLTRIAIVSGWGPVDKPQARSGLPWFTRVTLALWRRVPLLARLAMWWLALNARLFPQVMLRLARRQLPPPDQRIIDQPEVRTLMLAELHEVFRRGGGRGQAHEVWLYSKPWGFRVEGITVPVALWHGEADTVVPVSMGRYIADAIPSCRATFYPNQGHFMLYDHFEEVLSALVA